VPPKIQMIFKLKIIVIAGLVPATHEHRDRSLSPVVFMDGRHEGGHDDGWVQTHNVPYAAIFSSASISARSGPDLGG
jgi:hypothetical protein